MKRLILVYNPRSSRYADVEREVISKTTKLKGYLVGKFEVAPTNLDDNIKKLSQIIKAGDLIISAGGDATGVIASNAILKANQNATLAVLPYGNFNDLSRTLGTGNLEKALRAQNSPKKFYPLEIIVDDKLFRYATCYITIGMTAESVKIYDEPKNRQKLKTSFGRKVGSYITLAKWYFKNRHRKQFLPKFQLNKKTVPPKTSDYFAINGRYVARVMKGGMDYLSPQTFKSATFRLTNFWRLVKMMVPSIVRSISASETQSDILEFAQPSTVTMQAEGESVSLKNIRSIKIKKANQYLKVIVL